MKDLGENRGTLSFEGSERLGHGAPPYYLAYTYARKNATKKDKPTSSHIYVAHPKLDDLSTRVSKMEGMQTTAAAVVVVGVPLVLGLLALFQARTNKKDRILREQEQELHEQEQALLEEMFRDVKTLVERGAELQARQHTAPKSYPPDNGRRQGLDRAANSSSRTTANIDPAGPQLLRSLLYNPLEHFPYATA